MDSGTFFGARIELRRQLKLVAALHVIALALVGLHLYVYRLPHTLSPIPQTTDPEFAWWGLWPVTYVPDWIVWLAGMTVAGLIAGYWIGEIRLQRQAADAHSAELDQYTNQVSNSQRQFYALIVVSFLLVVAFFSFPIVHTRWGDAYMLARAIAWPNPAQRLTHSWQAPLDVFLHSRVWLTFGEPRGWTDDASGVYRLLSPLAGALYLGVVLLLSRMRALAPAWLTVGLLTTVGVMQLFFGYVENYSFAAVGILAYLWLGIRLVAGVGPLWIVATILALSHATHPSTIVLAPSLLYLGWICRQRRNLSWVAVVLQIGTPMLLVAGGVIVLMEAGGHGIDALLTGDRPGGGDGRWLVPLFDTTTRWEHYTMFSWPHLRDWLNQQMLVAPVVLPSLAVFAIFGAIQRPANRHGAKNRRLGSGAAGIAQNQSTAVHLPVSALTFLAVAGAFYLLFTWVWNPDYGGQRDWDLFSLAAIPLTLLLIAKTSLTLRRRFVRMGMIPLILVQALHTSAWIFQNTRPWEWP